MCRDNGLKAIENLMEKKGKFDYILLETTGLADPGDSSSLFSLFTQSVSLMPSVCLFSQSYTLKFTLKPL